VPDAVRSCLRPKASSETVSDEKDEKMSAFTEHKDELEHYEQMFGKERGRLAVGLDRLTNALVLVGQHGVYCTSQRNPTLPAMDIRMITQETCSRQRTRAVRDGSHSAGQGRRREITIFRRGTDCFGVPPLSWL